MKKIVISLLLLTSTAVYAEEQQWSGPDFLIIGAQKSGTSALYQYLIKHPSIKVPKRKEIMMEFYQNKTGLYTFLEKKTEPFDSFFKKNIIWYQSQFPSKKEGEFFLTGEASQIYLSILDAQQTFYELFPNLKLILIMRNPVDRAFSEYKMLLRKKQETRTFEEAIEREVQESKNYLNNSHFSNAYYAHEGYIILGIYVNHLKRWMEYFPREQFLILLSDDLLNNPAETVNKVFSFLGLPEYTLDSYPKYFVAPNNDIKMKPETREMLTTLFRPFNQELQDLLNNEFGLDIQLNWN